MKELRFWIIFFSIVAIIIWFTGRLMRDELPGRGDWVGRTYTNEESGICLTVPDGYQIDTDEKIIELYHYSEDVFENVKREMYYCDMQIESGNSLLYTVYMNTSFSGTAEQYINLTRVNYTQRQREAGRNAVSSEKFEKVLCGQTYGCLKITYEDVEPYYMLWCLRKIPNKGWVFIHIEADSEEKANEMLTAFDTETVKASTFKKIYWWIERVFWLPELK